MAELSPEVLAWIAETNRKAKAEIVVIGSDVVIPRRYTSGSLALDVALGGGFPGNQWTEIVGPESAGKTMVALKAIAANQKLDPNFTTYWLGAESYNSEYAAMCGVDNSRVVVSPVRKMELALELTEFATASKLYDCVVLDSYPALLPDEEAEKAMDENTMALGARLFNKFWRKAGEASHRATDGSERPFFGIVINQWRDKIGGFAPNPNAKPQTSPGGHGKDYSFYVRLKITHKEFLKEKRPGLGDVIVGKTLHISTIKNKTTSPQQSAEPDFYFRNAPFTGFHRGDYDLGKEFVTLGKLFGVIGISGSWLTYDGQQWQGEPAMQAAVREDLELQKKLREEVLEVTADPRRQDDIARETAEKQPKVTRKRRSA